MYSPDFADAARHFIQRGWQAEQLGEAIWRYRPPRAPALRLLLSAGVHGDETAPIELLARRLPAWAAADEVRDVELCVALGNLDAIAASRRFIHQDMNRLFGETGAYPGAGSSSGEVRRAAQLRQAAAGFIAHGPGALTVHLDLHTTIRPSLRSTFAIVPTADTSSPILRWLGRARLQAAVLGAVSAPTLSAFSARRGALACTVELGRVGVFGGNDIGVLASFEQGLDSLVRAPEREWTAVGPSPIEVFQVTQELVRHSEHFELLVPASAPNFTPLRPDQVVARDEGRIYLSRHPGECVLFPNPSVALGQRAGLLAAPLAAARA
jgi:succinylglutamate desuccinylase